MCVDCHVDIKRPYLTWLGLGNVLEWEQLSDLGAAIDKQLKVPIGYYDQAINLPLTDWHQILTRLRTAKTAAGRHAYWLLAFELEKAYAHNDYRHLKLARGEHKPVTARKYRQAGVR